MLPFLLTLIAASSAVFFTLFTYAFPQTTLQSDVKGMAVIPFATPTLSASSQPSQGSGGQAGSPTPTDIVSTTTPEAPTISLPHMYKHPLPSPTQSSPSITIDPTSSLTPTSSPIPLFPTPSISSSIINTSLSPTISPSSTPQPTVVVQQNTSSLNADIIFTLVNNHRQQLGLPSFQKDDKTCAIAAQRAPQVYNELFVSHTPDAGLKAMNISYWITENIIYDDTEQDAVDWWLGDTVHRQAIEGNYQYSCVACSGLSCAEIFTNYIAK